MMGMGEPLANFENVVTALDLMLDDNAYGLSRRRVTVSTSGLVPALDRLRERCPVALAVSLHAPNDALRDRLSRLTGSIRSGNCLPPAKGIFRPRLAISSRSNMSCWMVSTTSRACSGTDTADSQYPLQIQPDPVQSFSKFRLRTFTEGRHIALSGCADGSGTGYNSAQDAWR